jgi:glycosyltransferase involved in cell wall biosynthesis
MSAISTAHAAPTLDSLQPGHILFVTGEYPPMAGGVGAYTAEVAKALVARGWQISVLTGVKAHGDAPNVAGVNVYPVVEQWGWPLLRAGIYWAGRVGATWLHVQYQTAAFGMHPAINIAPAWWRRQGVRVAWTYHDILVPYLFPKAGARLRRWVTDLPARVCDLTIATNGGDYAHLAARARNLTAIPIGSNIRAPIADEPTRQAWRIAHGYGREKLIIGYFGFLNHTKGGLDLIEIVARLLPTVPTLHLLMIGEQVGASDPTNYAYLQQVKALIEVRALTDRVMWTGLLPDAEVSAALAACDLLLMPYADGATLRRGTLMAGLAHGCAIVTTTPTAPIPELVAGRDLLYVPAGEIEAAAQAVQALVADPQRLESLRHHARLASQQFAWERIAAAHQEAYWRASEQPR